jgi:hypothetical protein
MNSGYALSPTVEEAVQIFETARLLLQFQMKQTRIMRQVGQLCWLTVVTIIPETDNLNI